MIIGDHAIIPENIDSGSLDWISSIPVYRVTIRLIDETILEQFVPNQEQAERLMKLISKAIDSSAAIRDDARRAMIGDQGSGQSSTG
jgi:hypothetical protein